MNSQQGAEPKGVSRPSRGEDGLLRQSQETQAAVGVDAPNPPRDAAGAGPAASPQHGRELAGVRIEVQAPIQHCLACGALIWFGLTKKGKACPFDVVDGARTTVTHFSTCREVRQFERGRGKR
jgi:hypothetical protein